jgi:hypothetical protein
MSRISLAIATFGLGLAVGVPAIAAAGAITLLPVAPASASVATPSVQSAPTDTAKPSIAYVKQGTEITLRLSKQITTERRALNVGDLFDLETAAPVMLGSLTVVPEGTKASGEVMYVDNKGGWGHNGRLICRLLYLMVGDRRIRISGTIDNKGKGGAWAMVGLYPIAWLVALGPVSGFLSTGKSARIQAGATVKGVIAEDIPVDISGNEKAAASAAPASTGQSAVPAPVAQSAAPASVSH